MRSTCMRSPKMAGTVMIRRCFNDEVVAMATAGIGQGRAAVSRCGGAARATAITQSQAVAVDTLLAVAAAVQEVPPRREELRRTLYAAFPIITWERISHFETIKRHIIVAEASRQYRARRDGPVSTNYTLGNINFSDGKCPGASRRPSRTVQDFMPPKNLQFNFKHKALEYL